MAINSFRGTAGGKIASQLFSRETPKRFPANVVESARRKLDMVHAAAKLDDLKVPPNNRLEKLKGDRKGQHSIRINDQWRVCFVWKDGNAEQVEVVDYH